MDYTFHAKRPPAVGTPQSAPIPGREREMVKNRAGGHAFNESQGTLLDRFLIMGTCHNVFYATRQDLTDEHLRALAPYVREQPETVARRLAEVSDAGRAASNSPALYLLAHMLAHPMDKVRAAAATAFHPTVRTGAHLLEFMAYLKPRRSAGRRVRRLVSDWLMARGVRDLLHQALKYQRRFDWTWQDVVRTCHPRTTGGHRQVAEWMAGKREAFEGMAPADTAQYDAVRGLREYPRADIASTVREASLTREMVSGLPGFAEQKTRAWRALAESMPAHALVRNLANLTVNDAVSDGVIVRLQALTEPEAMRRTRLHPLAVLKAWFTYSSGKGVRGRQAWKPVHSVVEILGAAFETATTTLKPLEGRVLVGIDVSGSMYGKPAAGMDFVDCAQTAFAYAYTLVKSCANVDVVAFDFNGRYWEIGDDLKRCDLTSAFQMAGRFGGGGTDVSIPFRYALSKRRKYDLMIMFTDNMSWSGVHPAQALEAYRSVVNADVRVVYATLAPYRTTLTAPEDDRAMDIVGFDARASEIIRQFHEGM